MKGAHSLADDHTNRSGTGLFIRFGGHGPVSELPDLEHRRYDHRRLFCPWGGGLCHVGRRGTPDPGHSCRHAGGQLRGFVTAFLQTRLGIPSILAGIVTNTGLYTVNLMAMGWKANQSLLGGSTVFTMLRDSRHRRRLVRVAAGGFCHHSGRRTAAGISENTHGPFHPGYRR